VNDKDGIKMGFGGWVSWGPWLTVSIV